LYGQFPDGSNEASRHCNVVVRGKLQSEWPDQQDTSCTASPQHCKGVGQRQQLQTVLGQGAMPKQSEHRTVETLRLQTKKFKNIRTFSLLGNF
jgi:hypothetical protein